MKSLVEIINEGMPNDIFVNVLNAKSQREFGMELGKLDKLFKNKFRVFSTDTKLPSEYKGRYFVAFDPIYGQLVYGDYNNGYIIKWDKNRVSNRYVGPAIFFSESLDIYDVEYQLKDVMFDLKLKADNTPLR